MFRQSNKVKDLQISSLQEQVRNIFYINAKNQTRQLAALLNPYLEKNQELETLLNYANASVAEIGELVNNELSISDLKKGIYQVKTSPVKFDALLKNILMAAIGRAKEKGINVNLILNGVLQNEKTSTPDSLWIKSDAQLLKTIFANLLSNAIKFTERNGHIDISITLTKKSNGLSLQASVKDSGVGMSPAAISNLFKEFQQVHTNTAEKDFGGTGLGLSFVKHMTNLMGCEISVASQQGSGSTFNLFWDNIDEPSECEKEFFLAEDNTHPFLVTQDGHKDTEENIQFICHELRNYFANIISVLTEVKLITLDKMQADISRLIEVESKANQAIVSAENALELFNNCLYLAKYLAQLKSRTGTIFNLNKLLKEITSSFTLKIQMKHIKLNLTCDIEDNFFVKSEYEFIKQIFINLISHEVNGARENSFITINLTVQNNANSLVLTTSIKKHNSENLSFLTHLSNNSPELKLKLELEGIKVALQVARPTLEETQVFMLKAIEVSAQRPQTHSKKVLVVDDMKIALRLMTKMVTTLGYTCVVAENGEQAVELFAEHKGDFALVLMDECMEPMGGFEATINLREIEKKLGNNPCMIVGLSGNTGAESLEEAKQVGMNSFLSKPLKKETLQSLLPKKTKKILNAPISIQPVPSVLQKQVHSYPIPFISQHSASIFKQKEISVHKQEMEVIEQLPATPKEIPTQQACCSIQ